MQVAAALVLRNSTAVIIGGDEVALLPFRSHRLLQLRLRLLFTRVVVYSLGMAHLLRCQLLQIIVWIVIALLRAVRVNLWAST